MAAWPAAFAPLPVSPYKGLEAFGQDDAHLFFGREAMTDVLATAVDAGGLVPVVGASGAGKSSLVHAASFRAWPRNGPTGGSCPCDPARP